MRSAIWNVTRPRRERNPAIAATGRTLREGAGLSDVEADTVGSHSHVAL